MMNTKKTLMAVLAVSALAFGLAACKKAEEGPAERAGKKIDEATTTAGQKIDEVTAKVGEKMQEAGKEIQKAADDAKK